MKQRTLQIFTVSLLAVAVLGLIIYAAVTEVNLNTYKQQAAEQAIGNFEELIEGIQGLNTKFLKVAASADGKSSAEILSDVWRQTGEIQKCVAEIPMDEKVKLEMTAYLNQAGGYAKRLSQKLRVGEEMTEQEKEQLSQVRTACGQLTQKLMDAWNGNYLGDVALDEFAIGSEGALIDFAAQDYPRLTYDGPFSESLQGKEPRNLGEGEVSEQTALQIAKQFLECDLSKAGGTDGDIPTYRFVGADVQISVTKQGGKILSFFYDRQGGVSALPTAARENEIMGIASAFLQDKGYPGCTSSYVQYYDGCALVNMVPSQDGVLLYPDIIKLWVDLSQNIVVGMDATNFLVSHCKRELAEPSVAMWEARSALLAELSVGKCRQVVIPLETGVEAYCYEFACSLEGSDCLIYIDTVTGRQMDILALLHTNNGTLTK